MGIELSSLDSCSFRYTLLAYSSSIILIMCYYSSLWVMIFLNLLRFELIGFIFTLLTLNVQMIANNTIT